MLRLTDQKQAIFRGALLSFLSVFMGRPISKDEFLVRAISRFGDRYDYSLVEYRSYKSPVKLKCNILISLLMNVYICFLDNIEFKYMFDYFIK